jgi:hypothetical protein
VFWSPEQMHEERARPERRLRDEMRLGGIAAYARQSACIMVA